MNKEQLELEKLKLEVKELKKPFYLQISTIAFFVPFISIVVAYFLNREYIMSSLELEAKKNELHKIELDEDLKKLEAKEANFINSIKKYKKTFDDLNNKVSSLTAYSKDLEKKYKDALDKLILSAKASGNPKDVIKLKVFAIANDTTKPAYSLNLKIDPAFQSAYYLNKSGDYKESERLLQRTLSSEGLNQFTMANMFLLLAKNYIQMSDVAQAKMILKSIVENYSNNNDGVLKETNDFLDKIDELEKGKIKKIF